MNTSNANNSDLAKLVNRNGWRLWTPKFRAFLIRKCLEFVLDEPFPKSPRTVPSEVPGMGQRLETPEELLARQKRWLEGNKSLWGYIIEAMDGEAASITAGARANDGLHAYQLLRGRYEPTSASSGLMIFFSLLTFTMTQSLEKHILQFKDKLRELAPHQNWFLNPMQVCSIFLRSLSPKYRQWVQQKMTDADRDPTLLYTPELTYAQTME